MKLLIAVKSKNMCESSDVLVNLDTGTLFLKRKDYTADIVYLCGNREIVVASLGNLIEASWGKDVLDEFWNSFCAGIMCLENCNFDGVKVIISTAESLKTDWVAYDKKVDTYKLIRFTQSREGVCQIAYSIPVIFK